MDVFKEEAVDYVSPQALQQKTVALEEAAK
jgi:hypothetical protein